MSACVAAVGLQLTVIAGGPQPGKSSRIYPPAPPGAPQTPPRFGQSGTGSISYVFANLMEKILDLKVKNVTGFKSGHDTDLGLERGKIDCRATSDITVIREPWTS